jgi:hypothetical protein
MARKSRPPGFDMTYRPAESASFGPPLRERLPVFGYLAFTLAVTGVIVYGQNAPSGSRLFQYVVEGDRHRLISSSVCAILLVVSSVAATLREGLRGVVVHPEGVEIRELVAFGWPKVRRFAWTQIDRVAVPRADAPAGSIRLDLWDGSQTWLPSVRDTAGLAVILERVALARAIPVEGGTGLLDDVEEGAPEDGVPVT